LLRAEPGGAETGLTGFRQPAEFEDPAAVYFGFARRAEITDVQTATVAIGEGADAPRAGPKMIAETSERARSQGDLEEGGVDLDKIEFWSTRTPPISCGNAAVYLTNERGEMALLDLNE